MAGWESETDDNRIDDISNNYWPAPSAVGRCWEENPAKRLYVWFDAVIGYLSASVEWARRTGDPDAWRRFWCNPEASSFYFMGKDNITFHSQIWPAELLGYAGKGARGGEPGVYGELNLPTEVVSSEFLTMEGKQFSTSRGYTILVRDVLERYGPDGIRYFICAAGPESQDANFTWFSVESENFESIHNHSAYAYIEARPQPR